MHYPIIILFTLLFISSCTITAPLATTAPPLLEKPASPITGDSILFLGFDIFKKLESVPNVIALNTKTVQAGLLKQDISAAPTLPKGKIRCTILDANKQRMKSVVLENPLSAHVEYIHDHHDCTGEGHETHTEHQLDRQLMEKEKAFFSFRTRYTEQMKYVLVELADEEGNPAGTKTFEL